MSRQPAPHTLLAVAALLSLPSILCAAQDFTGYGTPELMQMREQMRYWDQADRDAYRAEMQTRMQSMAADERAAARARAGGDGARGAGQGRRYGAGDGSRSGRGSGTGPGGAHGYGYGRGPGAGGR